MRIVRIRALLPVVAMALLAGGQAQAHSEEGTYDSAAIIVSCSPCLGFNVGGVGFPAVGEYPVAVTIADELSTTIAFEVCQSSDGDTFCGEAGEPDVLGCGTSADLTSSQVPFRPDLVTTVFISTTDPACIGSTATTGRVIVTYDV